MPNTKSETDYETRYVEQARKRGHLCPKLGILGEQGWPDRMVLEDIRPAQDFLHEILRDYGFPRFETDRLVKRLLHSAFRFVEFKAPGGEFQPRQPHVIRELRARGFRVDIIEGDTLVDLP